MCEKTASEAKVKGGNPWAHRGRGLRCGTCMWFCEGVGEGGPGRCRKHAPTLNGYPVVFEIDWCGDHKLS